MTDNAIEALAPSDVAQLLRSGRVLRGSGKRSLVAAQKRLESGASRVAHMAGGLAAWKAAGLPVLSAIP